MINVFHNLANSISNYKLNDVKIMDYFDLILKYWNKLLKNLKIFLYFKS